MTQIGTPGKNLPSPLKGLCEEASMFSSYKYIPCSAPSTKAVYLKGDDTTYRMCEGCADHNVRNRGGELVEEKAA